MALLLYLLLLHEESNIFIVKPGARGQRPRAPGYSSGSGRKVIHAIRPAQPRDTSVMQQMTARE